MTCIGSPQKCIWMVVTQVFVTWMDLDLTFWPVLNTIKPSQVDEVYDFIVIGSGTAGSIVGGRLSEISKWRTLVLEAGGEKNKINTIPWFHLFLVNNPGDWRYVTEPNSFDSLRAYPDGRSWWWRGKVIGGTSSINTMIYMRGNSLDYDQWESEHGCDNWSYQKCLPYFKKLENIQSPTMRLDTKYHGTSGPMVVEHARHSTPLYSAFVEAGRMLGFLNPDPNGAVQAGFSPFQFNIKDGYRLTPADAYLRSESRNNLHVSLNTQVSKLLIDDATNTAYGVEVVDDNGVYRRIYATKEVILSAGVIGSPQLLMLSGIGPGDHLKEKDIPVKVSLPGVGKNLQDHIAAYGLTWLTKSPASGYNPFWYIANFATYLNWKFHNTGPLAAPIGVEGNIFVSSKYANLTWPDLQITFVSTHPGFDGGTTYKDFLEISDKFFQEYFAANAFQEGFSFYPIINRPKSKGYIKLRSKNFRDHPIIQPNYLSDPDDVRVLIEGLKIAKVIGDSPAFAKYGARFNTQEIPACSTLPKHSDPYWECYVRHLANTDHHPVGTCKMGSVDDLHSVVDSRLRVRGVKRLRVVDGSVMPRIVSGNINTPIMMIAERASDFIKEDYADRI